MEDGDWGECWSPEKPIGAYVDPFDPSAGDGDAGGADGAEFGGATPLTAIVRDAWCGGAAGGPSFAMATPSGTFEESGVESIHRDGGDEAENNATHDWTGAHEMLAQISVDPVTPAAWPAAWPAAMTATHLGGAAVGSPWWADLNPTVRSRWLFLNQNRNEGFIAVSARV